MALGGTDVLVSLPRPVGEVTYDEWHSSLLGPVPGWLIGFGLLLNLDVSVFGLTVLILVAAALIGPTRREPWYFLTALGLTAATTYGVGSWPWP